MTKTHRHYHEMSGKCPGSWYGMILGSEAKSFQLTFNFIVGYLIGFAWIRWSCCWCTWHWSNCLDSDFIEDLDNYYKTMIRKMDVITVLEKVTWFIMLSASSSSPDSANALSEIKKSFLYFSHLLCHITYVTWIMCVSEEAIYILTVSYGP